MNKHRFALGGLTANAGTKITALVTPDRGSHGMAKGTKPLSTTVIDKIIYKVAGTAHKLYLMRPLNYTTLTADAAAGQAVINVAANPGAFATAYQFGTPSSAAVKTANNLAAASDYLAIQTPDGSWILDTISSISSLAITMTTNITTGGVEEGALVYFFGVETDTDPATGKAHPYIETGTSTVHEFGNGMAPLFQALHAGDPIMLLSDNGSAAGTFGLIGGYYAEI